MSTNRKTVTDTQSDVESLEIYTERQSNYEDNYQRNSDRYDVITVKDIIKT